MKPLLTFFILIVALSGCKAPPASKAHVDGFKVDYFTKDFYTYINNNGWSLEQGGYSNGRLRYKISHINGPVGISMDYDQESKLATSFEMSYPKGDSASELLLEDILNNIDGIETFVKVTENKSAEEDGAGQPATAPESKVESEKKPQPESEGLSR